MLCLDEVFVTDVADAAIMSRLFGHMWDAGLVLVATSNRCSPHGAALAQVVQPFRPVRLQRRACAGSRARCTSAACSATCSCSPSALSGCSAAHVQEAGRAVRARPAARPVPALHRQAGAAVPGARHGVHDRLPAQVPLPAGPVVHQRPRRGVPPALMGPASCTRGRARRCRTGMPALATSAGSWSWRAPSSSSSSMPAFRHPPEAAAGAAEQALSRCCRGDGPRQRPRLTPRCRAAGGWRGAHASRAQRGAGSALPRDHRGCWGRAAAHQHRGHDGPQAGRAPGRWAALPARSWVEGA